MSIPLYELEIILRKARAQHTQVVVQMGRHGALLQKALEKDPTGPALHLYTYRCGAGSWSCRVAVTEAGIEAHALYYWFHGRTGQDKREALDAFLLRDAHRPLHFDTHFFGRWGQRSERMGVQLTNMMGFFRQYPRPPLQHVPKFYDAQPELGAALEQGLILARHHGNKMICCDTFKDHSLLSAEERTLWERLKALG